MLKTEILGKDDIVGISQWVELATKYNGEGYSVDHVQSMITNSIGRRHYYLVSKDDKLIGAFSTQFCGSDLQWDIGDLCMSNKIARKVLNEKLVSNVVYLVTGSRKQYHKIFRKCGFKLIGLIESFDNDTGKDIVICRKCNRMFSFVV